jgi:hypothetical protein
MAATVPTYGDFTTQYPAFADPRYATSGPLQLTLSINLFDPNVWDDLYAQAVMLDTAHNLVIDQVAAGSYGAGGFQMAAGPVSSASVGGTSTSFNSLSPSGKNSARDWYEKTSYGQKLLRLQAIAVPIGELCW